MTIPCHDFEHIRLEPIAGKFIKEKLVDICMKEEKKDRSNQALQTISRAVSGDMRKATNILEHFITEKSFINVENVNIYLPASGMVPVIANNQQYERFNVIFCIKNISHIQ